MRRNSWLILALATIISIALSACGESGGTGAIGTAGNSATAAPEAQAAAFEAPSAVPTAAAAAILDVLASDEPGAVAAAASVSAEEIVAAYGEVLSTIYESVLPSVVQVKVQQNPAAGRFSGSRELPQGTPIRGEGSGFVWSDQGHVVTNHHVIDGADQVRVIFADGSEFNAEVLVS